MPSVTYNELLVPASGKSWLAFPPTGLASQGPTSFPVDALAGAVVVEGIVLVVGGPTSWTSEGRWDGTSQTVIAVATHTIPVAAPSATRRRRAVALTAASFARARRVSSGPGGIAGIIGPPRFPHHPGVAAR